MSNENLEIANKSSDLHVTISELMIATSDHSDEMIDGTISDVLKILRNQMNMDVVFCSEFVDGKRVFRHIASSTDNPPIAIGASDELENSWCQRVVDGRLPRIIQDAALDPVASKLLTDLPFRIGTHISTPIILKSGEVYGTLCCFSHHPKEGSGEDDLATLVFTAKLTAAMLELKDSPVKSQLWKSDDHSKAIRDIRCGLDKGEFINYYQPNVDLQTGRIVGAEALIRWLHPEKGMLHPSEFVPLMEESGLIVEAGNAVMSRAMWDWRNWSERGLSPPPIAVKLAAKHFLSNNLVSLVKEVLSISGADGNLQTKMPLSIEVAESSVFGNLEITCEQLRALRDLGVTVALDDFGTGYSSLSHLAELPLDMLKIDRSFVMKMGAEPDYMAVVTTIIQLAHGLGLLVVAEGVETADEAQLLKLLRCDQAQGYLYSKPVPAEDFAAML